MMSGLSARRFVIPALTALLVTAAAAILWTLLYAAITAVAFKDMGLLRTVTEHDPTASLTHLRYYWSDARVPRHALIAAAATVVILGGLAISAWLIRPPSTFGDARFASSGEITRANLHAKTGFILGRRGGLLLRHDAPGHVLVEGPTRSGKGQGFVEPNLLTWEGSLICLDPKQENFKATAAARLARGDACFLFAPGSTRSHAYNPLDLVRRGPQMTTDLANLAAFLIPEPRGEGAFWASSARNLFAASLGYVLETPLAADGRHIGAVLALFSTGKDIAEALQVIVKTEAAHLSPFIVDQFNQFVPMPEKTRGSVVAHLIDALKPWNNPLVVAATARSDFNLRELRETPMAIYIGAPVADLESYRPLIRVLVQQAHDQLMRDLPETDDALPVLIMLDEFPTLQRMEAIVAKLPVSAGYGVRMAIVVQALSQLDELYGRATRDTILANTDLKLFVGTNDQATADYISEALGTRTALSRTVSGARSQNPFAPRSTTRTEVATRLMRPEQVRELDRSKAILLVRGERPVLLDKVVAHRDRMLIKLKRKGRDALVSVPELKAVRQSSPFASLQVTREHPPTPSTFTARRPDPRQGELALKLKVKEGSDRTAHEQRKEPSFAPAAADAKPDNAVERPKGDRAAETVDDEARLRVFLDRIADDMSEDRASRLKQSADAFLVLSRQFREDVAGA